MNDTTFQGCGKISYVPVVFNPCNKPQTNADRIRSMTDEEFSHFLFGIQCAPASRPKEWIEWLKQEVES